MRLSRGLHLSLWHTVSGVKWLGPDPPSASFYGRWGGGMEQLPSTPNYPLFFFLSIYADLSLLYASLLSWTLYLGKVYQMTDEDRRGCRHEALHIFLPGSIVHNIRHTQYGRQRLKAVSIQSIILRKDHSVFLHVSCADQLSANVSSIIFLSSHRDFFFQALYLVP